MANIAKAKQEYGQERSLKNTFALATAQYFLTLAIRGDNTPENAKYLGYLDGKDLYPDYNYPLSLEQYFEKALDGGANVVLTEY